MEVGSKFLKHSLMYSLIYIHSPRSLFLPQWIKQFVDMTYNLLRIVIVGQTPPPKIAVVEQSYFGFAW